MYDFEGKVAIVTGAASQRGIGHSCALRLAKEGASVVVVDLEVPIQRFLEEQRDTEWNGLSSVVEEIERLGHQAMAVSADTSDWSQVNLMAEKALERFGRIDILVNNAAVNQEPVPVVDLEEAVWDRVMAVNVKGVFLCSKRIAREMIQQRGGSIINMGSIAGRRGVANLGAYCSSKFAVVAITQVLALELAPYGIRVNAVYPGWVDTDMNVDLARKEAEEWGVRKQEANRRLAEQVIPLKRMARPDEIASVVTFLASDESSYLTGQGVNVTGGRRLD